MDTSDPTQLWKTTQGELQLQLTPDIYEMYVHPVKLIEAAGDTFVLACPNDYVVEWMRLRLDRVVRRSLNAIAGRPIVTRYVLAPDSQLSALPAQPANGAMALVRPGELRQAGYVQLWHDLRLLYGPLIGLTGIGLWAEVRAAINETERHPLRGYAWLSLRGIQDHYTEGRVAITRTIDAMAAAGLLHWQTGQELARTWEEHAAAGTPDRQNPGIPMHVLTRFFTNPAASRVYTVNDPLELPEFCARFDKTITLHAAANRCEFVDYPGRITARWQDWLKGLMVVNKLSTIGPDDWRTFGLL